VGWCFTFVSSSFLDCEVLWISRESFCDYFSFLSFDSVLISESFFIPLFSLWVCTSASTFFLISFFLPILFFLLGNISIVLSVFNSAPRISALSDRCRGFCFVSVCPRPCLSYRFTPRVFHKVVLSPNCRVSKSHRKCASDVCVKSLRFEIAKWIAKVFVKYRHYWLE
jgi:hypothetical protein